MAAGAVSPGSVWTAIWIWFGAPNVISTLRRLVTAISRAVRSWEMTWNMASLAREAYVELLVDMTAILARTKVIPTTVTNSPRDVHEGSQAKHPTNMCIFFNL